MTTIALRSEFKKDKVTSDFFVRSHFVNNLKPHRGFFKCREVVYTYSSEESYEKI